MNRRRFFGIASIALSTPAWGLFRSSDAYHDGSWWLGLPADLKLGYVMGFIDSDAHTYARLLATGDAKASPTQRNFLNWTGVSVKQVSDGLDAFYKDFRNKGIEVQFGIDYVKLEIQGADQQTLDRAVQRARKLMSLRY